MSYISGEDRGQAALLPAAIEDYVAADAPARVVDAFVDGLDVRELGFGHSVPAMTGRPPYDPRDLLKLCKRQAEAVQALKFHGMSWSIWEISQP